MQKNGIHYKLVAGEEIGGETGGKQVLLKFFDYLKKTNCLIDRFQSKTTVSIFFLDKDIDDLIRTKRRSEHIIYTEMYELENYLFVYGDIKTAAATAALIDIGSIAKYFGDYGIWRKKAAAYWKDWVKLCLFSCCYKIGSQSSYGRNISPINNGVCGPVKPKEFINYLSNLRINSGLSASKFDKCFNNLSKRVDKVYRLGQYDKIFKGKWYFKFLAEDIKNVAGSRRFRSDYLDETLLTGLLQTMNYDDSWAEYFKKPLSMMLAKARI